MRFTTRPELSGTFGMTASTHWIASATGMGVLERGGNAYDAAVAMGFVLHVVEPHLNGPMGDMPALVRPAGAEAPVVVCGQGTAPAGATLQHYRAEGLTMVPGSGLLATVIPGAFDAWMLILRDWGTWSLRDVLESAIYYARQGHPMLAAVARQIGDQADLFRDEWPTSVEVWLPGGAPPEAGQLFRNHALADCWERLLREAEAKRGRQEQIEAARDAFYRGFVAEAVDRYLRDACVMDSTGERRRGVLSADDMAGWHATVEAPVSVDHAGWTVWKCGPWSQGPVLLQALRILENDDVAAMDPTGADFVHLATEALKLAMADREAFYGDPDHAEIPLGTLLSPAYGAERRALVGTMASLEQRPGRISGFEALAAASVARAARDPGVRAGVGTGEPTMAHLSRREGDTVHIDVVDRWGNLFSATPSGGWLQSSPVIPGLGMPLNSRAQMFWLEEGLPTTLAPGRRPRTTLTPSMASRPGEVDLAFGTPGGDQQDQWQLIFFLRHVHHRMNLQEAIDAPLFHTPHVPASFWPRAAKPGALVVEPSFSQETLATLRSFGHDLTVTAPWAVGRLTAAARSSDGLLRAAATPRLMQAYAVGR